MKKILYLFIILLLLPLKVNAFTEEIDNWRVYKSETVAHNGKKSCFFSYTSGEYVIDIEYGIGEVSGILVSHPTFLTIPLPPTRYFDMELKINDDYVTTVSASSMGNGRLVIIALNNEEMKSKILDSTKMSLTFSGIPIFELILPEDKTGVLSVASKCFESVNNKTLSTIQNELSFELEALAEIDSEREFFARKVFNDVVNSENINNHQRGIKAQTENSYWKYTVIQVPKIIPPDDLKELFLTKFQVSACEVLDTALKYEDRTGYVISYGLSCSDADKPYYLLGYVIMRSENNESIDVSTIVYEDNLQSTIADLQKVFENIKSSFGINI